MTFLWLIVLVLACYRFTALVVFDDWPFGIMQTIRDKTGESDHWLIQQVHSGITCPYCFGVWAGALVFLLWLSNIPLLHGILYLLAIAGGQSVLQSLEAKA